MAVTDEPQTTTNWAVGAEGERKLGAGLDGLVGEGVVSLHDRLRPGTKANIDHLAIALSGVWVIDAKRYKATFGRRACDRCCASACVFSAHATSA